MQNLLHRSALDSGLTLLPGAIVMAFMSMTSGALYEKFGPRKLALVGMAIVVITTAYFVVMDEQTSTIMLATVYAIRMVGIALGLIPVMTHTMNQLKPEMNAHGSSMTNTVQQIAGSIGTAALITILSHASKKLFSNYVRL
ncbi:transport system protein [Staphylococcus aureus]|uniref:Transport system protein n=1 Tax=Staphylococcus aureus TaxID=1280 RepID=A0A2X2JRH4_STAAU|nr:transport system protein [Staphylococcus aureus]